MRGKRGKGVVLKATLISLLCFEGRRVSLFFSLFWWLSITLVGEEERIVDVPEL